MSYIILKEAAYFQRVF